MYTQLYYMLNYYVNNTKILLLQILTFPKLKLIFEVTLTHYVILLFKIKFSP